MTEGRPWPRTRRADYKSSQSIQFQPVGSAEKSRRYSRAGISYQLGTGFHAAAAAAVDGNRFFFSFPSSLSLFLPYPAENPVSLIYTVSRLNGHSRIKPSERRGRGSSGHVVGY